ncbi:MAG: FapA family protein [Fibromonadaceae bacterium]|jgi:uncharacterized protein (DUF342 family)|nr:FapA family protein [Fibromonadaceae bacterium]
MELLGSTNINESLKWLSWRISPEGTFLTVVRDLVPENWNIKEIKKTLLINRVVNFDIAKIESTIKAMSGNPERIGPPFELFEEGKRKYLHLHVTPIQARFSINTGILQTNYNITPEDILFILAEKSVVYGIDHELIKEILTLTAYGQEFIIASAKPPIAGTDAIVTEIIPIDPDAKPFLNEDGTADYKKWDNIRQIEKDEIICTRIPPTPGIPGTSVFGLPLSPTPGDDIALPVGMNTKAIDNETKLVATINGFLYRQGRNICIGSIYIINGDVNYKTGNIEYTGDVLIKGNVNTGFSVIADGNISIEGVVESAHIESKYGNIFLKGSVFGLNNASIIAQKNINAENIQDTKIKAGQNLVVKGQIRSCQIETENLSMPRNGQIVSSSIAFHGQLKCGNIGGKIESTNEFTLVENEREQYKDELTKQNEFIQKLDKAIEVLNYKLSSIKTTAITPESENQVKLLSSQLTSCNNSRNQLIVRRKKLLKLIEIMPDRANLISATSVSPILKISIFGSNMELKEELQDLKISWINGSIKMESL